MIIGISHYIIIIALNSLTCIYIFSNFGIHSGGGLFLRTSLAESLSIFHDLAMGETAATEARHRWNAEGAGMPPLPKHRKNKGRRHQSEENKATP